MTTLTTATTTGVCAACRLPDLQIQRPDSERYPDAVPEPVCGGCDPLHPLELGAAVLEDPTPAERAAAESVWRTVLNPEAPCRCSGDAAGEDGTGLKPCDHGAPCDPDDEDGCTGRVIHLDRYGCGLLSTPDWWCDVYVCSECRDSEISEHHIPAIPWGELTQNEFGGLSYSLYKGARHMNFGNSSDERLLADAAGLDAEEDDETT